MPESEFEKWFEYRKHQTKARYAPYDVRMMKAAFNGGRLVEIEKIKKLLEKYGEKKDGI